MDIKAGLRNRFDSARAFIQLHFKSVVVLTLITSILIPFWLYTLFSLSPLYSILLSLPLSFLLSLILIDISLSFTSKHYKKLLAFLTVLFIILTPLCTDIVSNGGAFYSFLPVHVSVWVEEPLSADSARIITLMALESINQTFGYNMRLTSVNTFQNDSIEFYNRGNHSRIYELAHLRAKAIADGHVSINITFLKGAGPESETSSGAGHADGLSDWADNIYLYFYSLEDIFSPANIEPLQSTFWSIQKTLHEFGHSFGLKHDIHSIMWTAEKAANPTDAPNPINISYQAEDLPMPAEVGENMTLQECFENYIRPNVAGEIWHNYSKARSEFNGTSTSGYSQRHFYVLHDDDYRNITLVSVDDIYFNVYGHIVRKFSVKRCVFDLGEFGHYWLPGELAKC